ncbi:MAG TPA: hypothetical protein VGJ97_05240, partial [Anaerolineaceae bacterium]
MSQKASSTKFVFMGGLMFLTLLLSAVQISPVRAAAVCYVNHGASGANTGGAWTDAYQDLQSALHDATCTEIWVAAGTYTPGTQRTDTFQLKNGVAIYGGFDGTETLLSQYNYRRNVTILSGEIGAPGPADNSYHVVTGSGTNSTAALIGFTITAGNANGASPNNAGGGIINEGGSPSLSYLTFTANSADYGAGMSNTSSSSPMMMYCTFSGNNATAMGGGIY